MIRLDIDFVVQLLSLCIHSPKQSHMETTLRVVRYIKGTVGLGLFMSNKSCSELVAYYDSNRGSCVESKKSVTGYVVKLGTATIS